MRQHADHHLDGHEGEDQPERDPEPARVVRASVRVPMRMVVHLQIMHVCKIMAT